MLFSHCMLFKHPQTNAADVPRTEKIKSYRKHKTLIMVKGTECARPSMAAHFIHLLQSCFLLLFLILLLQLRLFGCHTSVHGRCLALPLLPFSFLKPLLVRYLLLNRSLFVEHKKVTMIPRSNEDMGSVSLLQARETSTHQHLGTAQLAYNHLQ